MLRSPKKIVKRKTIEGRKNTTGRTGYQGKNDPLADKMDPPRKPLRLLMKSKGRKTYAKRETKIGGKI